MPRILQVLKNLSSCPVLPRGLSTLEVGMGVGGRGGGRWRGRGMDHVLSRPPTLRAVRSCQRQWQLCVPQEDAQIQE